MASVSRRLLPIMVFFYATGVHAYMDDFCCPNLYLGADAQLRHMPFKENYGKNIFPQNYPQGNVYFGLKGNEYLGLEVGYEFSKTRTRNTYAPSESFLMGRQIPCCIRINSVVRFKGLHASVVGFFPVVWDERFTVLGAIGMVNQRITLQNFITEYENRPTSLNSIKLTQSQYVLRLMAGLQFMFNKTVGVRANLRWENTNKFDNITPMRSPSGCTAKVKNSVVVGLGPFIQF